jgi:pilus assembly protein Flp/PilA
MIKWFALAARFLHEEDGPTAVEYAIMLALIILVCFSAIQAVGSNVNNKFNDPTLNTALGNGS